jgi:hypothetical protein
MQVAPLKKSAKSKNSGQKSNQSSPRQWDAVSRKSSIHSTEGIIPKDLNKDDSPVKQPANTSSSDDDIEIKLPFNTIRITLPDAESNKVIYQRRLE